MLSAVAATVTQLAACFILPKFIKIASFFRASAIETFATQCPSSSKNYTMALVDQHIVIKLKRPISRLESLKLSQFDCVLIAIRILHIRELSSSMWYLMMINTYELEEVELHVTNVVHCLIDAHQVELKLGGANARLVTRSAQIYGHNSHDGSVTW